jgi:hypothetical protein
LWGAPRIDRGLLKLGFEVAESTVSKYMIRRRRPPSQSWRTFLRNHADAIAAIDLCVVPPLTASSPSSAARRLDGHPARVRRSRRSRSLVSLNAEPPDTVVTAPRVFKVAQGAGSTLGATAFTGK